MTTTPANVAVAATPSASASSDMPGPTKTASTRAARFASASAQERLDLLVKYREEYFARFRESIKTGIHATEWRNFQSFIGKLDRAIGQQKDVLERARARVVEEQQGVLRERRRLDSYDTLRDRALATEQVEEARRSQRASDEFAARAHLNAALTD